MRAARNRLLAEGYAGLSTRKVADEAAVPLSQLHYHYGSKGGLILALLEEENKRLLDRQTRMYAEDRPLWQRYEQACDFLDDDLESGYVRVLQEMIAAGWSNPEIGDAVRELLSGWYLLLAGWPGTRSAATGRSARSPPRRWPRWSATPFSGRKRCCCSTSSARPCRSGPPCAGSAS
jgi:AcrR family transcriptional regulator